jgi:ssDNA-binding Zn-finger/Zn-ribbon topoisomerase 1
VSNVSASAVLFRYPLVDGGDRVELGPLARFVPFARLADDRDNIPSTRWLRRRHLFDAVDAFDVNTTGSWYRRAIYAVEWRRHRVTSPVNWFVGEIKATVPPPPAEVWVVLEVAFALLVTYAERLSAEMGCDALPECTRRTQDAARASVTCPACGARAGMLCESMVRHEIFFERCVHLARVRVYRGGGS